MAVLSFNRLSPGEGTEVKAFQGKEDAEFLIDKCIILYYYIKSHYFSVSCDEKMMNDHVQLLHPWLLNAMR